MSIPKEMQDKYDEIAVMLIEFCDKNSMKIMKIYVCDC